MGRSVGRIDGDREEMNLSYVRRLKVCILKVHLGYE